MDSAEEARRAEANRLYWSTQLNVADVAGRVGVSSGTLYGMIDPEPAGGRCPDCGGRLGFVNRTARDARLATCAQCEREHELPPPTSRSGRFSDAGADAPQATDAERQAGATAALIAGIAAGAILATLFRRS